MAEPTPTEETGHVPLWVVVLVGLAWLTITLGLAAYVGGLEALSP